MQVGHINLLKSMNGTGEHFVRLVEGLDRQNVRQHVIVRNEALARRLKLYDGVTVGPRARTAVTAYCLMPAVDIVHTHDEASGHAGLLLTLTRSIPYVASRRSALPPGRNPIIQSVYGRAVSVICPSDFAAAAIADQGLDVPVVVIPNIAVRDSQGSGQAVQRIVREHMRLYRRAARVSRARAPTG